MNYLVARVSDVKQRKALPAQRKKLFDYADKKEWVENRDYIYIEFDETAYKADRPDFNKLVIEPLLNEPELAIVVFDKIDRFSRDTTSDERMILTRLFKSGKIEIHFPSDNLFIHKNSPAADLFRLEIGISLASYYSSSIRDNVKRRFDQMLADGIWVGKAPIGYTNYQEKDAQGKTFKGIKIDAERNHHIHEAFELRASGMPYKSIAKEMEKRGLVSNTKHRKPVTTAQWEEILNNPWYIGTMRYDGKEYEHHYPLFIEQWLWDKCQEVKLQRSTGRTKYNSRPFLFKNIKCHTCGYSISFFEATNRNGLTYGHCTEYGGKHGAPYVNEEDILKQVRKVFASITLPKSELPRLVAEIEKNRQSEQEYYISTRTRLQKEYEELDTKVEELYEDRDKFSSRPDVFEKMVNKISERQKKIQQELADHSDGDKAFAIGATYILELCSRAVELFDAESTSLEQKRFLIDFVLSNMALDGKKLVFTLKEPFDVIAEFSKTSNWYTRYDSNVRPSVPKTDALIH